MEDSVTMDQSAKPKLKKMNCQLIKKLLGIKNENI